MIITRRTDPRPQPISKATSLAVAATCAFLVMTAINAIAAPRDTDLLSAVAGLCAGIAVFSFTMRTGYPRFEKIALAVMIGAAGYGVAEYARTTTSSDPTAKTVQHQEASRP